MTPQPLHLLLRPGTTSSVGACSAGTWPPCRYPAPLPNRRIHNFSPRTPCLTGCSALHCPSPQLLAPHIPSRRLFGPSPPFHLLGVLFAQAQPQAVMVQRAFELVVVLGLVADVNIVSGCTCPGGLPDRLCRPLATPPPHGRDVHVYSDCTSPPTPADPRGCRWVSHPG